MNANPIYITPYLLEYFNSRFLPPIYTTCWEWFGQEDGKGYGRMKIKSGKKYLAHRVSYQIHKGLVPTDKCVCHTCDNPRCVNPDHLWLGTIEENTKDRNKKGRSAPQHGEHNPQTKLTEEIVRAIKNDKRTQRIIAKEYGLSFQHVSNIKLGIRWGHVT